MGLNTVQRYCATCDAAAAKAGALRNSDVHLFICLFVRLSSELMRPQSYGCHICLFLREKLPCEIRAGGGGLLDVHELATLVKAYRCYITCD